MFKKLLQTKFRECTDFDFVLCLVIATVVFNFGLGIASVVSASALLSTDVDICWPC